MELRTGEPYWAIRNGLLQSYPPVRSDQSAEVVVLGAGITGALVARALALEGADVLVVDRHDVAMGSSAACYRFVHALLADAVRRGVRVFDRTEIVRITAGRSGVVLETDRGHRITAGRFISAAGYQTEEELLRTSADLSSTWAMANEPVDSFAGWEDRCLIWETARPYFYLRTTDDGRVVAGGRDRGSRSRHESRRQLQRQADAIASRVRDMFPAMNLEVAYRWGGVFATTEDSLPIVGTRPEFPNTWFALGYGGNGITFSVMAAAVIRDAYRGDVHPAADRPSLSPSQGILKVPKRA